MPREQYKLTVAADPVLRSAYGDKNTAWTWPFWTADNCDEPFVMAPKAQCSFLKVHPVS
jgi:hypothetical protein